MNDTLAARPSASGWYVDDRCTNCDVARQLAPDLIHEVDGRSELLRQPRDAAEEHRVRAAAFACHTRSIRPTTGRLDDQWDPYPLPVDGTGGIDDGDETDATVLFCGHNSTRTAGANSYLLRRPSGNLMMVDTPRWSETLAARYERIGTVTDVLLTHRDHAAHGRRYADRFAARLWIHEGDLDAAPDADRVLRATTASRSATGSSPIRCPATRRDGPVRRRRAVLLQRRQLLLVAYDGRHRGGGERHLVLHRGAGRLVGPHGRTAPLRVAAARTRRPQAPARRRNGGPDARVDRSDGDAAAPAGGLHGHPLVTYGRGREGPRPGGENMRRASLLSSVVA